MELFAAKAGGLRNIARGILPTVSTWDTNPTNLANATDGNPTTATGAGSKVLGGAGTVGYITLDLGRLTNIIFGAKIGQSTTASTVSCYSEWSTDNSTWMIGNTPASTGSGTEYIDNTLPMVCYAQYIRFRFRCNSASTVSCKIYEIFAYDLGGL